MTAHGPAAWYRSAAARRLAAAEHRHDIQAAEGLAGTPRRGLRRISDAGLCNLLVGGLLVIAAWYLATRTTLVLVYGGHTASLSLSAAHSFCDSGLGLLGRSLSARAAANCASIDARLMWLDAGGFAGLLAAVGSAAALLWRRTR